jgi:hypothetical protein
MGKSQIFNCEVRIEKRILVVASLPPLAAAAATGCQRQTVDDDEALLLHPLGPPVVQNSPQAWSSRSGMWVA